MRPRSQCNHRMSAPAAVKRHLTGAQQRAAGTDRRFFRVYNLVALLAWPLLLCYYAIMVLARGKYRQSYLSRLGLKPMERLPSASRRIWFHALSVGETLSVVPLVQAVKSKAPELDIVFSTATEAGQRIARERLDRYVRHFVYLPHDFPWIIDHFVRRVDAGCFVLVETDIWPNLLRALERYGAKRFLVNGRLSPKSTGRHRALGAFFPVFGWFDRIFAQSVQDRDRFAGLGARPDRVHAVGNLKFDSQPAPLSGQEIAGLRKLTGIDESRAVWIAGSTHGGEEELLFEVHRGLRRRHRDLLLIVAPRHVDRALRIAAIARRFGLSTATRSSGAPCTGTAVYLLDTLGELGRFYALAQVAFIGGSMVPFGGHNPLEAVVQGKPCVWGPHLFNFREIEAVLLDAGIAGRATSARQLMDEIDRWLKNSASRAEVALRVADLVRASAGCANIISSHILAAAAGPAKPVLD